MEPGMLRAQQAASDSEMKSNKRVQIYVELYNVLSRSRLWYPLNEAMQLKLLQ